MASGNWHNGTINFFWVQAGISRSEQLSILAVMELIEGASVHELLKAQTHVWNLIYNSINSMSLKCAVELGIPDIIHNHGQPMTLSELVAELSIPSTKTDCTRRLMRLLVHSGFFALQKIGNQEEGYVLTPSSKLLLKDSNTSMSTFLLMMLDQVMVTPLQCWSEWFRGNDRTAFETAYGVPFWDYLVHNPKINNMFNEAMAKDSRMVMNILVKEYGVAFNGLQSIVDVGGGTGTTAAIIAEAFPHLKCTVFDLEHVVATIPERANVALVGGDMFNSIPHADAVFLKWILHDWSDEDCIKILRQCKEAISSVKEGGKVIIVDMVLNRVDGDSMSTETQLFWDLCLMLHLAGKERDEHEWRKLFLDAGFAHYKITPLLGLRSVIELYP